MLKAKRRPEYGDISADVVPPGLSRQTLRLVRRDAGAERDADLLRKEEDCCNRATD